MVAVLCVVVFAVSWAARPESWYWLLPPDNETAQNRPARNEEAKPKASNRHFVDVGAIDTDSTKPTDSGKEEPVDRTSDNKVVPHNKTEAHSANSSSADLPAQWLKPISDQVMGLRAVEADTYYRILAHISRLDDRYLKKQTRNDVLYVNMLRNPDLYRGKLITLQGTARRITETQVGKNQYGAKKAYEAWVLTPDSGSNPLRLVATGIDPRLPVGENVAVEVEVTGYFLKLYSYAAEGGQRQAPLILAARITPYVVRKTVPSSTGLEPYILAFALFIGLGTIISITVYSRGDREFKQKLETDFCEVNVPPDDFFEQLQQNDENRNLFS